MQSVGTINSTKEGAICPDLSVRLLGLNVHRNVLNCRGGAEREGGVSRYLRIASASTLRADLRSCVKVEVAVLGSRP